MFKKWMASYFGHIYDTDAAKKCIDDFRGICENREIIFWGGNSHGKTMLRLFNDLGLKVDAFADTNYKQIKTLDGIAVIDPHDLKAQSSGRIVIGTVNQANYKSITEYARQIDIDSEIENGFSMHLPLQSAYCLLKSESERLIYSNCSGCTRLNHTCKIFTDNIKKYKGNYNKPSTAVTEDLTLMSVILGTVCSLKCKCCIEGVPYVPVKSKGFYDKDSILEDIKTLSSVCDYVSSLDFVGGEPFLHPDLPEIIYEVRRLNNIGIINVFTNGTVLPKKELLEQLKQDFVVVSLANYGHNLSAGLQARIVETKSILVQNNVDLFETKDGTWSDAGLFEFEDDSIGTLQLRFANCIMKDCYRFADGKLFRCPHHYAGYVTGKLDTDDSVVNVRLQHTHKELVNRLNQFVRLPYIEACQYCELPYKSKPVSSGTQL
jgi:hypothetical protein